MYWANPKNTGFIRNSNAVKKYYRRLDWLFDIMVGYTQEETSKDLLKDGMPNKIIFV